MGPPGAAGPPGERLQKVLARLGVGSRRACEALIAAGRVEVDGEVVREQGRRVDPERCVIRVDGSRLVTRPDLVYLAVHKPRGVVSTMHDPQGRPDLAGLLGQRRERLFHVGRLDADTEGLLLLTNDGELAHRLSHPSFGVPKTYLAEVPGPVPRGIGRQLREGVELADGPVQVDRFRVVTGAGGRALVEVVVHEGRKHVVRRLLAEVGLPVVTLVRTRFGPVALGDLRPGRTRPLSRQEVADLFAAVDL
ncbi:MAG: pseudouridine synthase [Actinomycetota bacterium]